MLDRGILERTTADRDRLFHGLLFFLKRGDGLIPVAASHRRMIHNTNRDMPVMKVNTGMS
jgi:hypothetical protein